MTITITAQNQPTADLPDIEERRATAERSRAPAGSNGRHRRASSQRQARATVARCRTVARLGRVGSVWAWWTTTAGVAQRSPWVRSAGEADDLHKRLPVPCRRPRHDRLDGAREERCPRVAAPVPRHADGRDGTSVNPARTGRSAFFLGSAEHRQQPVGHLGGEAHDPGYYSSITSARRRRGPRRREQPLVRRPEARQFSGQRTTTWRATP